MRLIDIEAVLKVAELAGKEYVSIDFLKGFEQVDAVPVVRCKDCVWYSDEVEDVIGWCDRNDEHAVNAGGFCSHGERKQP